MLPDGTGTAPQPSPNSGMTSGSEERDRASLSSYLETVPDDIFINITSRLDLAGLLSLEASRDLRTRVHSLGIPTYLLNHTFPHVTLDPPARQWPAHRLVRHNHRIGTQLHHRKWHAAQVGPTWPQAVIPVMELTADRLFIGAGGKLIVHPLSPPRARADRRDQGEGYGYGPRVIEKERVYSVTKKLDGSRGDIVGIAPLADGQVVVAQFDGTVQRLSLGGIRNSTSAGAGAGAGSPAGAQGANSLRSTAHYSSAKRESGKKAAIHTLAHDGDTFMTTTTDSSGQPCALVYSARSPWVDPVQIPFPSTEPRAWSSLVNVSSGYLAPSIMLGLSFGISIYDLQPSGRPSGGPSGQPTRQLCGPDPPARSSAYDIHSPPPNSTHHPSLLLSAWFDSHLRLHDLRSPSPEAIMQFSDPWTWADGSAMYSSAFYGQYGIAGGGARHGTVCLFDIRNPKNKVVKTSPPNSANDRGRGRGGGEGVKGGWSIFSPGGKGSPVYSIKGEGGRIWGVTEKRAFVLAFDSYSGSAGDSAAGSSADQAQVQVQGQGHGQNRILSEELMMDLQRERKATVRGGPKGRDAPNGWRRRGGRWSWTVRYDEDEGKGTGYEHTQRGVDLFEGLPLL